MTLGRTDGETGELTKWYRIDI